MFSQNCCHCQGVIGVLLLLLLRLFIVYTKAHLNFIIVLMLTLFIALFVCYSGGAKITVKGKHFLSVYETFMEITRQIGNRKDHFKSAVSLH